MQKFALALAVTFALALPALAQKKDDAAKAVANPTIFYKGQIKGQSLARDRFLGAKVINKDNQVVGTIDDLIIGAGGSIEGVILGVGGFLGVGEKKIGVRIGALKITATDDGKTTIALPGATKEMLAAVDPYQRAFPAKK